MNGNGYQSEGMTDFDENINWDEVGIPISVGSYDAELVAAEYKLTSTNKHMISAQFKILNAYDPENDRFQDKMLFENFVFTAAAAFRVKNFAKVTGVDLPGTINKIVLEDWAKEALGTQVGITVVHGMWNGEKKANVGKFFPVGEGGDVEEVKEEKTKKPAAKSTKPVTKATKAVKPDFTPEPEEEEEEEEEDEDENTSDEVEETDSDDVEETPVPTPVPPVRSITSALNKKPEAVAAKKRAAK